MALDIIGTCHRAGPCCGLAMSSSDSRHAKPSALRGGGAINHMKSSRLKARLWAALLLAYTAGSRGNAWQAQGPNRLLSGRRCTKRDAGKVLHVPRGGSFSKLAAAVDAEQQLLQSPQQQALTVSPTLTTSLDSLDPKNGPVPPGKRADSGENFLFWLLSWPRLTLVPEIRVPVFVQLLWSFFLLYMYRVGKFAGIDQSVHNLLSGTLGFFLTFRANEGYKCCVDARQVWEGVMNKSRDFVRVCIAGEDYIGSARAKRLVDLVCAFGVALEEYVMQQPRANELELLLRESDLAALSVTSNRPLTIIELLNEELIAAAAQGASVRNSIHYPRLLNTLDELSGYVTRCERLMRPPVPPVYYGFGIRFLTAWIYTLPLALVNKLPGWAFVGGMCMITWALFGLRELGVRAQYPFKTGAVNMKALWKEVVWDARATFEAARLAREVNGTVSSQQHGTRR